MLHANRTGRSRSMLFPIESFVNMCACAAFAVMCVTKLCPPDKHLLFHCLFLVNNESVKQVSSGSSHTNASSFFLNRPCVFHHWHFRWLNEFQCQGVSQLTAMLKALPLASALFLKKQTQDSDFRFRGGFELTSTDFCHGSKTVDRQDQIRLKQKRRFHQRLRCSTVRSMPCVPDTVISCQFQHFLLAQ